MQRKVEGQKKLTAWERDRLKKFSVTVLPFQPIGVSWHRNTSGWPMSAMVLGAKETLPGWPAQTDHMLSRTEEMCQLGAGCECEKGALPLPLTGLPCVDVEAVEDHMLVFGEAKADLCSRVSRRTCLDTLVSLALQTDVIELTKVCKTVEVRKARTARARRKRGPARLNRFTTLENGRKRSALDATVFDDLAIIPSHSMQVGGREVAGTGAAIVFDGFYSTTTTTLDKLVVMADRLSQEV